MYDEDGYPTEEALAKIATFEGTPKSMLDYITLLFDGGSVRYARGVDGNGRVRHEVTFVTNGWSGAESVLGRLNETIFRDAGWNSSHRGGLEIFHFHDGIWEEHGFWGEYRHAPGYEMPPTAEDLLRAQIKNPSREVVNAMIDAWNNAEPDRQILHTASYVRTFVEMWWAGVAALK